MPNQKASEPSRGGPPLTAKRNAPPAARRRARGLMAIALAFASITVWAKKTDPDVDLATREAMVVMARQLGVTCTYCHNPQNFRDNSLPAHKIAKEHMRIVTTLNGQDGFAGKLKADCYTCHRGSAKYQHREPAPAKGNGKSQAPAGAGHH